MIEKVNPSHPDKVADRIAGAIVDLAYTKNDDCRIAVEVLIGHGMCHVICETSEDIKFEEVDKIDYNGCCVGFEEALREDISNTIKNIALEKAIKETEDMLIKLLKELLET